MQSGKPPEGFELIGTHEKLKPSCRVTTKEVLFSILEDKELSDEEVSEHFLKQSENIKKLANAVDGHAKTAVDKAFCKGWLETAKVLIAAGAKVNADGVLGETVREHHFAVVRYLVEEHKANPRVVDDMSRTLLHHCTNKPGPVVDLMKLLLKHNVKVDARDHAGSTALANLCSGFYWEKAPQFKAERERAIKILVNEYKADPNSVNINGFTPLICLAGSDLTEAASVLIQRGANVNAKSHIGESALTRAAGRGQLTMLRLLMKSGIREEFPLITAIHNGQEACVDMLVEAKADVNGNYAHPRTLTPLRAVAYSVYCNKEAFFETAVRIGKKLLAAGADPKGCQKDCEYLAGNKWQQLAAALDIPAKEEQKRELPEPVVPSSPILMDPPLGDVLGWGFTRTPTFPISIGSHSPVLRTRGSSSPLNEDLWGTPSPNASMSPVIKKSF